MKDRKLKFSINAHQNGSFWGVNDDEQNFHRKLNQFSQPESVEDISLMAFCFGTTKFN